MRYRLGQFCWVLLLCISALCSNAIAQTQAHSIPISLECRALPLKQVLLKLEQEYSIYFSYNEELIQDKTLPPISIINNPLDKALSQILHPVSLDFEIIEEQYIVIQERDEPIVPKQILCGQVRDSLSQDPLPWSTVFVRKQRKGDLTNSTGKFQIEGYFDLKDSIEFSHLGYQSQKLPIELFLSPACPSVDLSFEEITFSEVLIEDQAIELLRAAEHGLGQKLRPDQMGVLPGWGDNDVLRMAELLPGVQAGEESVASLSIRGGTPDQNLILWDDIPIYHTGHFFGIFSAFNPHVVDEVSVFRGGYGARFGERISGVIDISGMPRQLDSIEVGGGANLLNVHGYVNIPLSKGKSSLFLAGRRSYTDIIESSTYQSLFQQLSGRGRIVEDKSFAQEVSDKFRVQLLLEPDLFFNDINAKWVWKPNPDTDVQISFYNGLDELDYDVRPDQVGNPFNTQDNIRLENAGLSINWDQRWNPSVSTNTKFVSSAFETNYRYFLHPPEKGPTTNYEHASTLDDTKLELNQSFNLTPQHQLHTGYHISRKEAAFQARTSRDTQVNKVQQNFGLTVHTFYFDFDLNPSDRLTLDFGMRYNIPALSKDGFWEPRFSMDYRMGKRWHLKATAGRYIQFVSQMQFSNPLAIGDRIWITADDKIGLLPVISSQLSFGSWLDYKGLLIDVEGYYKKMSNLSTLNLEFKFEESPFSYGEGTVWGMDILFKKKWKAYNLWLAYSLSRVAYTFPTVNKSLPFPGSHDQRHQVNLTQTYRLKNWEFSASWNFASGRPYTSVRGIFSPPNQDNPRIIYNERNGDRLPAYHRLDLSTTYLFGKNKLKGKVGFSIFNVYNRTNFFSRDFLLSGSNDSDDPRLLRFDRELLGLTPNAFFELRW